MSVFTFNYWFQNSMNSALKSFPSTLYMPGDSYPCSKGVTFQQILRPPGPPGAWPPGNKGARYIEMTIMYLHSSESQSQVARGQDDRKTIPSFISQLLSHTPLQPENRPEKSSEKRFESPCTKVTRNHKVQLLFFWRERVCREPQRTQMFLLLIKWNKINCTHQANDSSWLFRAVSL